MANELDKKRRRTRFFLYQDDKNVVIGKQSVRYEPDVKKNIFGAICVETMFPKKKEAKHSFRLDLYPDVHEENPSLNIFADPDNGCQHLFIEANRSAALMVRSICNVKQSDFNYDNLTTLSEDKVKPAMNGFRADTHVLKGIIKKTGRWDFLRKGDVVYIGDCEERIDSENKRIYYTWDCSWDPSKQKWKWYECIRRLWYRLMNNKMYARRYVMPDFIDVDVGDVRVVSGDPVEENTDRD